MSIYKFSPDLMTVEDLNEISVGREQVVEEVTKRIEQTTKDNSSYFALLIGPRGIGKTHTIMTIHHNLSRHSNVLRIRLSEEEYSINSIEALFQRILEVLGVSHDDGTSVEVALKYLQEKRSNNISPVLFVDNLQMLFEQLEPELPLLRSIMQERRLFSIVGSALSNIDEVSEDHRPFYHLFDHYFLTGLSYLETRELIRKRLEMARKKDMLNSFSQYKDRVKGIKILTGGNPRLIHSLCEILIQQSSLEEIETSILTLLDQLTPYYQARMESLSVENRRIIDTIALAEGPMTPTEVSDILKKKIGIVVSQMRRLRKEGLVDIIELVPKRETRYQITERLYRIWREMRTSGGSRKINLLVDFLRIWYNPTELSEEFHRFSDIFDTSVEKSKESARMSLVHMCYIVNALGNRGLYELAIALIPRFVANGDIQLAQLEIDNAKKRIGKESNPILKQLLEFHVIIAQIMLYRHARQKSNLLAYVEKMKQKLPEIEKSMTSNELDEDDKVFWLHEGFFAAAEIFHEINAIDEATKYVNLSLKVVNNECVPATNLKLEILNSSGESREALSIIQKMMPSLEEQEEREQLLSRKIEAEMKLKNHDAAVVDTLNLVDSNINSVTVALYVFMKLGLYDEFDKIFNRYLSSPESSKKNSTLTELSDGVLHIMAHAIHDDNNDLVNYASKKLKVLTGIMTAKQLITIVIKNVLQFARKDVKTVYSLMAVIREILTKEQLEGIRPIRYALEFIQTRKPEIFETLHKESRQMVIDVVTSISPNIEIPKEVQESLND